MPPPKARLHSKTGKLKTINKSYSSSSSSGQETGSSASSRRNNRVVEITVTQNEARNNTSAPAASSAPSPIASTSDAMQQFEIELCWCIQTMEKSLESGGISAKQAQDTEKSIRLLKSANQPLVKKRQIMNAAFGDYRAKMQEEEKRLSLGTRSFHFIDDSGSSGEAGKKCVSTVPNATAATASKSYFVKKSLTSTLGEKMFQFDFPVHEIENLKIDPAQPSSTEPDAAATNIAAVNGPLIPSKLISSDNSFKFNFSIN